MRVDLPLKPDMRSNPLGVRNRLIKRSFDIFFALLISPIIIPVSILLIILAKIFNDRGLFIQTRIGRYGENFQLYKICSMRNIEGFVTNVTTDKDPRITLFGRLIRKTKLDEFPQLLNVLKGDMSFVGPRPDVTEAYKGLRFEDIIVLNVRPGITGLASVKFKNEEALLASVDDPEQYNQDVIFPAKIKLNKNYVMNYSFWGDIKIMCLTILQIFSK